MSSQKRVLRTSFQLTPHRQGHHDNLVYDIRIDQNYEIYEEIQNSNGWSSTKRILDSQEVGVTIIPGVKANAVMGILNAVEGQQIEFYPPSED